MQWSRYLTPEMTWAAMLEDIRNAENTIDCETYILKPSGIGDEFLAAFRDKVRQGVKVRLLCDMVGSYTFFRSELPQKLREAGIEVRFFNPIKAWRIRSFTSWFFRDHRKLLVIDGKIGYTGGVGFEEAMRTWRDTHLRLEGGVVQDMQWAFQGLWRGIEQDPHPFVNPPRITEEGANFLESAPIVRHGRRLRQNFIYRDFLSAINGAQSYLYFTSPYFIPPLRFVRSLRAAVKRGVEVRLLVPQHSDQSIIDAATHSYFGTLLRAGIRVFAYQDNVIHAKTAISDDRWASVGSANLDNLSFFFNYEGNVVTSDRRLIDTLKQDFLNDCAKSLEITRADWRKRSWVQKAREFVTWPLHGIF